MKNGDLPASALSGDAYTDFSHYREDDKNTSYNPECQGLTKREQFAAMALQGLLSKSMPTKTIYQKAELSVKYADALLAELAK